MVNRASGQSDRKRARVRVCMCVCVCVWRVLGGKLCLLHVPEHVRNFESDIYCRHCEGVGGVFSGGWHLSALPASIER